MKPWVRGSWSGGDTNVGGVHNFSLDSTCKVRCKSIITHNQHTGSKKRKRNTLFYNQTDIERIRIANSKIRIANNTGRSEEAKHEGNTSLYTSEEVKSEETKHEGNTSLYTSEEVKSEETEHEGNTSLYTSDEVKHDFCKKDSGTSKSQPPEQQAEEATASVPNITKPIPKDHSTKTKYKHICGNPSRCMMAGTKKIKIRNKTISVKKFNKDDKLNFYYTYGRGNIKTKSRKWSKIMGEQIKEEKEKRKEKKKNQNYQSYIKKK